MPLNELYSDLIYIENYLNINLLLRKEEDYIVVGHFGMVDDGYMVDGYWLNYDGMVYEDEKLSLLTCINKFVFKYK